MPTHPDELRDDALQEEIDLVGALVVAASHADGRLSEREVDRLLGVGAAGEDDQPKRPEM